jgi:hypothetical protein
VSTNLEKKLGRRTGWIFPAAVLLVSLICGGVYGFNSVALHDATRQLEEARGRRELLRPMAEKMLLADAKAATIDRKQTVLTSLTKDRL